MTTGFRHALALCALLTLASVAMPAAQAASTATATPGKLEKIRVHGASLDGNLQGNDATRDVHVYLPPGYEKGRKRYPVIYFLHGYAVTADIYVGSVLGIPASTDKAMSSGARETIIVMPDAFTAFGGSFYSNSPVIGDWESYIAQDLVRYIDSHYRTIAKREGRGLSGHSMGGYGTFRIGMKYPQVFGALYAMSSAVNIPAPNAESVKTQLGRMAEGIRNEPRSSTNGVQAQASAWAPNPQKPPYFLDLPFDAQGNAVPLIAEKWAANSPLFMLDQYVPAMKSFRDIMLDVGNQDGLQASNAQMDAALTRLGVKHTYEVYEGTHGNRVGARFIDKVLPFFEKSLDAR